MVEKVEVVKDDLEHYTDWKVITTSGVIGWVTQGCLMICVKLAE